VEAYVSENAGRDPGIRTLPSEVSDVDFRRIHAIREVALILLVALVLVGLTGFLGVRAGTVSASANGYELLVKHPWITRGGEDADWSLEVTRRGGFDRPVTIAYTREYLDFFQVENVFPEPASQVSSPPYLYFTFAVPPGEDLDIAFPAQAIPSVTDAGRHGAEVIVLVDGRPMVRASYNTWLVP
jgi:hypothetical protein